MLEAQVNLASLASLANLVSLASLANLVSLVNLASLVNLVSLASLVNLVSLDSLVNLDSPPMTQRSRRRATLPSDRSDHPVPSFPCIQCIPWLTFPVSRSPFPISQIRLSKIALPLRVWDGLARQGFSFCPCALPNAYPLYV